MRFTQLSELISRAKSAEEIEKYNKEKSEILDNLFPGMVQFMAVEMDCLPLLEQ